MDINTACFSGRLTRDPKLIVIPAEEGKRERTICTFKLVVYETWREGSVRKMRRNFIPCVCFSGFAIVLHDQLQKGMRIMVSGRVRSDTYVHANKVIRELQLSIVNASWDQHEPIPILEDIPLDLDDQPRVYDTLDDPSAEPPS